MMAQHVDIEKARRWLEEHCHHADVRCTLLRGVEYVEAMEHSGLIPENTSGDDLYAFLTDPVADAARVRSFVVPTL